MRYVKPHFYDSFVCTAGDCPDTCCAGWQIMIDEESLERYENEPGEFGKILRNSIDWEEECFYQNNRRCAFLNDENLCDLSSSEVHRKFPDRDYQLKLGRRPQHADEYWHRRNRPASLPDR